jgi:hypothetical protein
MTATTTTAKSRGKAATNPLTTTLTCGKAGTTMNARRGRHNDDGADDAGQGRHDVDDDDGDDECAARPARRRRRRRRMHSEAGTTTRGKAGTTSTTTTNTQRSRHDDGAKAR